MSLYRLLVGILVVAACGETCYFVDDVCPNGDITFWLRTRHTDPEGIEITEDNLDTIPLIHDAPLKILIHGYAGDKNKAPNMELIYAYFKRGTYNIISVDWGMISLEDCFIHAAYNAPVVGRCTARLLQKLYARKGKEWKVATHVIGFCLGAHVAGVLGHHLPHLPRITGLDPTMLLFTAATSRLENRLDPTDANLVDIYHTNGGWQGRLTELGHMDFYFNNGATQPGCNSNSSCDHHRAIYIYAESINSQTDFFGEVCEVRTISYLIGFSKEICPYYSRGTVVMAGEYVYPVIPGTYKVETNGHPPFATGFPVWSTYTPFHA